MRVGMSYKLLCLEKPQIATMFYSKDSFQCEDDVNKLFQSSMTLENDALQNDNRRAATMFQSFNQSPSVNRSSSSGDSMSSELFSDFPTFLPRQELIRYHDFQRNSTPVGRRIVGRKALCQTEPLQTVTENPHKKNHNELFSDVLPTPTRRVLDDQFMIWQSDDSFSRNSVTSTTENHSFYELFPTDNRNLGFKTPVSSPRANYQMNTSPSSSYSLNTLNNTYKSFGTPPSPVPWTNFSKPRPDTPRNPKYTPNKSFSEVGGANMCTFCRKNGETPGVYTTHRVKEQINGELVVTCPILRSHVCTTCRATGDKAHTITYCPVLRNTNNGNRIPSTTITLKNTRVKSNGRRRF